MPGESAHVLEKGQPTLQRPFPKKAAQTILFKSVVLLLSQLASRALFLPCVRGPCKFHQAAPETISLYS